MSEYVCQQCGESFDSPKSRGMHRRWNHTNPWEEKEQLEELYLTKRLSTTEIADRWECGSSTISEWLEKHGIEQRARGGSNKDAPWKDEETLRELYLEQGLPMREIGERLGCSTEVVGDWIHKFDIETRRRGGFDTNEPYLDEDLLREVYLEEGLTQPEIAELWDCGVGTISRYMQKYDIYPIHYYSGDGRRHLREYYQIVVKENGAVYTLFAHQLVAFAHGKMSFQELFDFDVVVHHKNRVQWIDSPENLEVMSRSEHSRIHSNERWGNTD